MTTSAYGHLFPDNPKLTADAQVALITRYLARHPEIPALGRGNVLIHAFEDSPFLSRPQVAPWMAKFKRGDHLVVAELEQLGSDMQGIILALDQLKELGVVVHAVLWVGRPIERKVDVGLMLWAEVNVCRLQHEKISRRTKAALKAKREVGIRGGNAPFGWRRVKARRDSRGRVIARGYFMPDEKVLGTARRIRDLLKGGMSHRDLLLLLEREARMGSKKWESFRKTWWTGWRIQKHLKALKAFESGCNPNRPGSLKKRPTATSSADYPAVVASDAPRVDAPRNGSGQLSTVESSRLTSPVTIASAPRTCGASRVANT